MAAQCNKTTGVCASCGMNSSIAYAVDGPRSKRFYYSKRYATVVGLQFFQKVTKVITAALPNARVGANFSPYEFFTDPRDGIGYAQLYVPDPFQWIRLFRGDAAAVGPLCAQDKAFCGPGLTLPWSEDWAWANPIGSQQMVTMLVDMMRSAGRKSIYWGSPRICSRTLMGYSDLPRGMGGRGVRSTPSVFPQDVTLLPSIYADVR